MPSRLLTPVPITRDNLDVVVKAGWIKKDELCKGVSGRQGAGGLQVSAVAAHGAARSASRPSSGSRLNRLDRACACGC